MFLRTKFPYLLGAIAVLLSAAFLAPNFGILLFIGAAFMLGHLGAFMSPVSPPIKKTDEKRPKNPASSGGETIGLSLDALIVGLPAPFFISDRDGNILSTSAEAVKIMGYEKESDLVGKSLSSVIALKDEAGEPADYIPSEAERTFEAFIRRADQSLIPVMINQKILVNDRGSPLTLSAAHDLTAYKAT